MSRWFLFQLEKHLSHSCKIGWFPRLWTLNYRDGRLLVRISSPSFLLNISNLIRNELRDCFPEMFVSFFVEFFLVRQV